MVAIPLIWPVIKQLQSKVSAELKFIQEHFVSFYRCSVLYSMLLTKNTKAVLFITCDLMFLWPVTGKIQHIFERCLYIKWQTVQNASATCCYIRSHIANTIFYWTWLSYFSENAFSVRHDVMFPNLNIEYQSCTWLHSRTIEQNGFFEQAGCFFLSWIWRSRIQIYYQTTGQFSIMPHKLHALIVPETSATCPSKKIVLWSTVLADNGFSVTTLHKYIFYCCALWRLE